MTDTATADRPQHLIGLSVSNFLKIKLVELRFDEQDPSGFVIVSGANGSGKSSLLQSVMTPFTGEKPEKMLRAGEKEGHVIAETEDFVVKVSLTEASQYLTVRGKVGDKTTAALSKPRELLNAMFKGFMDPQEFADRMTEEERQKYLLKICPVPLDLVRNAQAVKTTFDERTLKNREVAKLEGQRAGFTQIPTERPVPVDTTAVIAERKRRESSNAERLQIKNAMDAAFEANTFAENEVRRLKSELEAAEKNLEKSKSLYDYHQKQMTAAPAFQTFDDLDEKISSAAQVATDIATFDQYERVTKDLQAAKAESEGLTLKIDELRAIREKALKDAEFPVEGLSLDHEGKLVFNGIPFAQESQAKRLRIAVALLAAANPKLRFCFIKEASLLDTASKKALFDMAKALDLQVFLEVVESNDPAAIQMSEGEVVAK